MASSETVETLVCRIPAMDCPSELALIAKALSPLPGIGELVPNYFERTLRLEFDGKRVSPAQIEAALDRAGFPAESPETKSAPTTGPSRLRSAVLLAATSLLGAAALAWAAGQSTASKALAIAATLVAGSFVAQAAWRALRLRAIDMNVLMAIAAIGGLATRHEFESATAMLLFNLALWIEAHSLERARRALGTLASLAPARVHRIEQDSLVECAADSLQLGDRYLVKPGERFATDGVVIQGRSAVNQAAISGESLPVAKSPGDPVFAGSLNCEGSLHVEATRLARESTLARISRLVEQAQSGRSSTQRFVDRFAHYYTPLVVLLAAAMAIGGASLSAAGVSLAADVAPGEWVYRGLVLLVIACPCALVISTPVTIVSGLHEAARRGMLIKGGQHLENAGRIRAIAFDKTGTLTTGCPRVTQVLAASEQDTRRLLALAAALERHSHHPLAAAVVAAAEAAEAPHLEARDVVALAGRGISGIVEGTRLWLGSGRWLTSERVIEAVELASIASRQSNAAAAVLVARQGKVLGALLVDDDLRPDALATIEKLRRIGIERLALLTGDSTSAATRVSEPLGLDQVEAELLPEEKLARVRALAERYRYLAMVGDGVNDAPALAAATLGIALGTEASATALETADVVLASPRLTRVVDLVSLGRRCRTVLAQNIALSLGLKLAVLVAAALGYGSLWIAVAADVGASLVVVANGLRMLSPREAAPSVGGK